MHAITAPPVITSTDRLGLTLFIAVAAHLLVILGVSFAPSDRDRRNTSTLDIVLVQQRSDEAPDDAQLLAQANQDGGGESDEPDRPATPLPAPFSANRALLAAAALPQLPSDPVVTNQPEPADPAPTAIEPAPPRPTPKPVLAQTRVQMPQKVTTQPLVKNRAEPRPDSQPKALAQPEQRAQAKPAPRPQAEPVPAETLDANTLVSRSLAMASLSAEIDERLKAYAQRPRRKWITSRTREHKFAAYMDAWRAKVERLGNLNYPDQARRDRLSGNLLLDVAINPDGTINDIILRRSSGKKVLDDAAIRIVKLAAPFAKFPPAIAEEIDILHIERTWRFLANNRFASR